MKNPHQESSVEQQWERRNLLMATLLPPHTHTQTSGPGSISTGCSGLTGVEPPQLAEAGQPEFE